VVDPADSTPGTEPRCTTPRTTTPGKHRRRGAGDGGAALVEFAFVMSLLFLLIFGIITFGLILSFKQDVTRAAAEGARAGAVAFPAPRPNAAAVTRPSEAVDGFDRVLCGAYNGMDCYVTCTTAQRASSRVPSTTTPAPTA
jgi:Flp pilus assembly protein TadG